MGKTPTQVTVRCSGRFVSATSEQLQSTVRGLIPTTKLLVLDLTGVNYIDSSARGAIVGLHLSSKRAGCQLKLINLTPRVKELFSMTRLTEVLESHAKGEQSRAIDAGWRPTTDATVATDQLLPKCIFFAALRFLAYFF